MSMWLAAPVLLLLLSLLWRRSTKSARCDAPGPLVLPLIGSCLCVWQPLWRWVEARGRSCYGDVIKIVFPDHVSVIVSGYDDLREVFLNESLLGRPAATQGSADRNSGLALSEGKMWRTHRTFSIRALSDCGWGRPTAQADISSQAELLVSRIRELLDSANGGEVDAERLVQRSVGAVIAKMIFGCDGLAEDERFFSKLPLVQSQEVSGMRSVTRMLLKRMVRFWPKLRQFLPQRKPQECVQEVLELFQKQIDQRRLDPHIPSDLNRRECTDCIEFYLKEKTNYFSDEDNEEILNKKHAAADVSLPDGRLAMTIFDLMTGGIDAVASLISWAFLLAAAHPTAQAKLRSEAAAVFCCAAEVNFSEKHRLPYTEAFLEEVHRFITPLPLGATRRAVKDTKIGGYRIPRGTRIVPNLYGLHHDPKLFPDPHAFLPERFINDEGRFQTSRYMLAFSLGKRACPGESLARMEAFVIVVSVLLSFSISLPEAERQRTTELLDGGHGFVRRPPSHQLVFTALEQIVASD